MEAIRSLLITSCIATAALLGCASSGERSDDRGSAVKQMQAACERAATRQKLSLRGAMTNRRHVGTGLWVGEYRAVDEAVPLARRGKERRLLCEYNEKSKEAALR